MTNSVTSLGLQGVTVKLSPTGATTVTGAAGSYSFDDIAIGAYTVSVSPTGYTPQTEDTGVVADGTTTVDFDLVPVQMVAVSIAITGTPAPDGSVTGNVNVTTFDGSTPTGFLWSQFGSLPPLTSGVQVPVAFGTPTAQSTSIDFGTEAEYKAALRSWIHTPERWDVLPISPYALEEGDGAQIQCQVTTGTGVYTATATIHVELEFAAWASGIRNVPIGVPVVMNGKTQASYNWAMTPPGGSTATLMDATTINPWFVPDVVGKYTLTVTDLVDGAQTIEVYAGTYHGVIVGQDGGTGYPTPDGACTGCHQPGGFADGNQFDDWRMSGHAEIFTTNVNTSTHYSTSCFPCHTVGYNTTADNGGFDDASDYQDFLDEIFPGGHHHPDLGNWTWMLANTPNTARLGNIQCENCHGPQDGGNAHMNKPGEPRVNVRADVCGFCHGEPPRHGRFQQWQESGHGNYQTAIDEGTGGSCARCHSAQGFVQQYYDGTVSALPTEEDVHPITCVVCHDPHFVGTVSGDANDANIRVVDTVPASPDYAGLGHYINNLAGYDITNAGTGAMCMSCHNDRYGYFNDSTGLSGSVADRGPHRGPQADMLYGQNAFFVTVGIPGKHSLLSDTCVTCHLQLTPPPEDYSYAGGGTNHSFEADLSICSDCHGVFDGGSLQAQYELGLEDLKAELEAAIADQIQAHLDAGRTVTVGGLVTITNADTWSVDELTESHGRNAIIVTVNSTTYDATALRSVTITGGGTGNIVDNGYFTNIDGVRQSEILARSCWNFGLLENDGSKGIHNFSFAADVFAATFEKVGSLTWL